MLLFHTPPEMPLADLAFAIATIPDLDHALADDRHNATGHLPRSSCRRCGWDAPCQCGWRGGWAGLDPPAQPGQPDIGRQRGGAQRDSFAKLLPCDRQVAPGDSQARIGKPDGQLAFQRRPALAAETVIDWVGLLASRADALNQGDSPQSTVRQRVRYCEKLRDSV